MVPARFPENPWMLREIVSTRSGRRNGSLVVQSKKDMGSTGSKSPMDKDSQRKANGRSHEPEPRRGWPELNLKKDVNTCFKNPGHKSFIPACDFSIKDMPKRLKKKWQFTFVQTWIELTVKLYVRTVSPARLKSYPDSSVPYPNHIPGGGLSTRSGSGCVCNVYKCGEGSGDEWSTDKTCECRSCRTSSDPKKSWWQVHIVTAEHVVFDDTECEDTDVTFFFDQPMQGVKVKGQSLEVLHTDIDRDVCVFIVCIHDETVAERLIKAWRCYKDLLMKHGEEWLKNDVFVVSHPHGCSKHITVGKQVGKGRDWWEPILYTSDTCPGSSGGTVVGGWKERRIGGLWYKDKHLYRYPHSEGLEDGINKSGGWGL